MADQAQELSSPISLKTLRTELQSYRKAVASDIKTQWKACTKRLRETFYLFVKKQKQTFERFVRNFLQISHLAHGTEMEKSLNDTMDRVAALENSREPWQKNAKKYTSNAQTWRTQPETKSEVHRNHGRS